MAEVEAAALPPPAPEVNWTRRGLMGAGGLAGLGGVLGLAYLTRQGGHAAPADDRTRVAHLLRRAGFPAAAVEVDAAVKAGFDATVQQLLHPERVDDSALETALRSAAFDLATIAGLRQWWLVRMAATRRPLVEKMTLFWHGLLTSSYRKTGKPPVGTKLMATQNQFLRDHALGSFRDLLVGISKDGAMLHWLDGTGSNKAHPNENYGRELMELFTMGVGNYSETDVREAARALTGWYVDATGTVGFRPRAHDDGVKTFLGRTGNLGLEEVVDTILANPATPKHLAGRLWAYFAYPSPSDVDLKPLVDAYHRTAGNVGAMLGALFQSPAFYSDQAYRGLVKSPTELLVGFSRQFSLPFDPLLVASGEAMGQALFDPPNVAGWPGGADWLNTGAWMARVKALLYQGGRNQAALHAAFAAGGATTPLAAVEHATLAMLDGHLSPGAAQAVHGHVAGQGGSLTPSGAADIVFLLGATPEYQLA